MIIEHDGLRKITFQLSSIAEKLIKKGDFNPKVEELLVVFDKLTLSVITLINGNKNQKDKVKEL
jgi:hypothetical protein